MDSIDSTLSPSRAPGARLLRFAPVRIVVGIFCVALAAGMVYAIFEAGPKPARIMWPHLLATVIVVLAYWGFVRIAEKRPLSEFGLRGATRELAAGCVLGAAAVATVLSLLYAGGAYHFVTIHPWSLAIAAPLAEMAFVSVFEEIVCRALIFRIAEQSLGSKIALAISALLFGLAHLPGGSAGALAIVVTVVAGFAFSAAFMLTRRLWMCIGIHFAWNYTLGSIFSIAVSGRPASGLMSGTLTGPDWVTGGTYGLEGSAITLLVLGALSAALLRRVWSKNLIVSLHSSPNSRWLDVRPEFEPHRKYLR